MELKIENLTKQYANKTAINHVTCTLKPGITGLLGANGAGKSTLMRMICGVMKPAEGKITLGEYDVTDKNYRNILGYLPQDFGYYPDFAGMEFLLYVAALKGLDKETAKKRSQKLLEQVNLEKDAKRKIKTYSGGMKRRLGIAQVLLNEPKLIVLDEPTAGLDPKERVRFRHIFEQLGKDNIVLLSTHIVSDIEKCADRILVIKDGEKVFDGTEEETEEALALVWNVFQEYEAPSHPFFKAFSVAFLMTVLEFVAPDTAFTLILCASIILPRIASAGLPRSFLCPNSSMFVILPSCTVTSTLTSPPNPLPLPV